jgi:tetratricopeptide (TPR) repeat protein
MQRAQQISLIGREKELDELGRGLSDAGAGRGGFFLLTGVPGIGKTRLGEALAELAEGQGMLAVWGRCWENPGAPAYWPWAQALRSIINGRDAALLADELGDSADWLAEIVPELRNRVPGIEPLDRLRSEQARFALFDAVGTFLRNVSRRDSMLLLFDDLHAADRESLALLDFVVRALTESPVMVVAAYQEAAAHARPEAERHFRRLSLEGRQIALGGMTKADVGLIVEEMLGVAPQPELIGALHATTEGNPLFAGEVARLLAAEGQLAVGWADGERERLPVPDTVRETIRHRFDPLGEPGIAMLRVGAVIGREFRFGTLERAAGSKSVELIELLDAAQAADLVVELPGAIGRFRFAHGLIRETLYADLATAERIRLHRVVGEALQEVHGDDREHLAELAHHFSEAAPGGDAAKALEYATRAGDEAMRVLAYERAAELFRLALEVGEQLPFDRERHAELTLRLGIALTRANDPSARETLLGAAEAARSANRPDLLADAALGIHVFNLSPGVPDDVAIALLEEALERIGPEDSRVRARLLARIATAIYYRFGTAERRNAMVTQAVAMARRLDDPATLAYVLINGQLATWGPDTTERDLAWVDELLVLTEEAGNTELAVQTRTRQIDYLLELDDLVGADIALEALERIAADSPDPRARAYLPLQRSRRAALDGRLEEAEQLNAEAVDIGASLEDRMVQLLGTAQQSMLRWTQGRIGEVEQIVRRFADAAPAIVGWRAALARIYCDLGRDDEARRELERLDEMGFANLPRYNGWVNMMALLAEVCAHLEERSRAAALYELLLPFERRNVVVAQCSFDGPVSRYLGIMAATAQRWDVAERHFEAARDSSKRMNARPFIALVAIDEARMLTERGNRADRSRAVKLLAEGERVARDIGLDRVAARAAEARLGVGDVDPGLDGAVRDSDAVAATAAAESADLRWEGDVWTFRFDGNAIHLRDGKGVRCLAVLLANPGVEIHALELAVSPIDANSPRRTEREDGLHAVVADDAGPALDAQAKSAYRTRLDALQELDEAESFNDPERAARLREEMDFLTQELAGAVGLGGRDRKTASNAERARVAVTKAVRATLKRIGEMDSSLGDELDATIRTGTFCSYEPDRRRPISWRVSDANAAKSR